MATLNGILDNLDYLYETRVQAALDNHAVRPVSPANCDKLFAGIASGIQALSKLYLDEAVRLVREIERVRALISNIKQAQKDNLVPENDSEAVLDDIYDHSKAVFRMRREMERAMRGVSDCGYALNTFGEVVEGEEGEDEYEEDEDEEQVEKQLEEQTEAEAEAVVDNISDDGESEKENLKPEKDLEAS